MISGHREILANWCVAQDLAEKLAFPTKKPVRISRAFPNSPRDVKIVVKIVVAGLGVERICDL